MECPHCARNTSPTQVFCVWCDTFVPSPAAGIRAGRWRRFLATLVDLAATTLSIAAIVAAAGYAVPAVGPGVAVVIGAMALVPGAVVWFLVARGRTPGKCLLGLRVVDAESGRVPGSGRLLARELVLKPLGVLAFVLGVVPAVRNRTRPPWHDRRAGTVVVRDRRPCVHE